jgi:hypothetical protein
MSDNNILDSFINKKKEESVYVSLEDGESVKVLKLRDIKMFTKPGFNGELKESLRLIVEVDTSDGVRVKNFDNSTARFANELKDKGVTLGSSFVLTRHGVQTNTRYEISQVKDASGNPVAPKATVTPQAAAASAAAAPASPSTPAA